MMTGGLGPVVLVAARALVVIVGGPRGEPPAIAGSSSAPPRRRHGQGLGGLYARRGQGVVRRGARGAGGCGARQEHPRPHRHRRRHPSCWHHSGHTTTSSAREAEEGRTASRTGGAGQDDRHVHGSCDLLCFTSRRIDNNATVAVLIEPSCGYSYFFFSSFFAHRLAVGTAMTDGGEEFPQNENQYEEVRTRTGNL